MRNERKKIVAINSEMVSVVKWHLFEYYLLVFARTWTVCIIKVKATATGFFHSFSQVNELIFVCSLKLLDDSIIRFTHHFQLMFRFRFAY